MDGKTNAINKSNPEVKGIIYQYTASGQVAQLALNFTNSNRERISGFDWTGTGSKMKFIGNVATYASFSTFSHTTSNIYFEKYYAEVKSSGMASMFSTLYRTALTADCNGTVKVNIDSDRGAVSNNLSKLDNTFTMDIIAGQISFREPIYASYRSKSTGVYTRFTIKIFDE